MAVEYPKREPFFAHKFVRMLTKSCAAQDIGLNAFALLCVIAHQEDSARYCGPVRFWNEQLMSTLALSPRALREARDKAVKFGWLTYFRENDRATGRYFVTIPKRFAGLSDAPIEEPEVFSGAVPCEVSSEASCADLHKEVHKEVTSNRTRSEHESAPEPSPPSIPIPDPIPLPETQGDAVASSVPQVAEAKSRRKPAFVKPTVSEIIAYVIEIKATVDAKEFFRHYESNGWMVGRNPMRNWQMAVQQWNARNKKGGLYDNARKPGHSAAAREQANADAFAAFDAAVAAQSGRNAADDWRGSDTPLLT